MKRYDHGDYGLQVWFKAKKKGEDNSTAWEEDVKCDSGMTAVEGARSVIDYFNDTLRPGEHARELVEVVKFKKG